MKENKEVFVISWFYYFISILTMCAHIALLLWLIIDINNPTLTSIAKIVFFTCLPVSCIFCFIIFGICFIQWVTVDQNGITARNLFKIIRKIEWSELTEVKSVFIGFAPINPKFKWLLLVDANKGDIYLNSPFNWKGRYIKIRDIKKIRNLISEYRADIVIL